MCREDVVTLPVGDDVVARARSGVEQFLRRSFTTRGSLVDDAQLIVSELVTNALRTGAPRVQLRLLAHIHEVRIGVHDQMPGRPDVRGRVAPTEPAGRGMAVVDRIARAWGVDDDPSGKTVWGTLPVRSGAGPRFNCRFAADWPGADTPPDLAGEVERRMSADRPETGGGMPRRPRSDRQPEEGASASS